MKQLKKMIPDALAVVGAFLISGGVCLIYVPAGIITAGVLAIAGAAIWSIGGDAE